MGKLCLVLPLFWNLLNNEIIVAFFVVKCHFTSMSKVATKIPFPVVEALPRIGSSIRTARIRRRKTAADLARRLGVSLPTLRKLEAGDPGVSLGTFVSALWLLDLMPQVVGALDPAKDALGMTLDLARMPKRARQQRGFDLADL